MASSAVAIMAESAPSDYYVRRRTGLLRTFDRVGKRIERTLRDKHGRADAADIVAETRSEFDRLLPELPYIGGARNIFTWVIVVNGWFVGLHRALARRGENPEQAVEVAVEVSDEMFRSVPAAILRAVGRLSFTGPARALLRAQAKRSQRRAHPQDFVYEFREGGEDDWALVFDECAVNKFYDAQGTEELKPYCNFFDVTYSRLMGMGVDARETIGLGCDTCSLRYKHGRATPTPARLKDVFDGLAPLPEAVAHGDDDRG